MIALRDFLWNNPWALAFATLSSLISFFVLVLPPLWRLLKYIRTAIGSSILEANRRSDLRATMIAIRCLDEPSFYIAYMVLNVLLTSVPVFFLTQNVIEIIASQPKANWTPASMNGLDKAMLFFAITAISLGLIRLLWNFAKIAIRVMAVSNYRRNAAKMAKGIQVRGRRGGQRGSRPDRKKADVS